MPSCVPSKRAREEDISIRVAAGEPVAAESFVLRALSSCARELPADAQEWDVSGLLAENGQPFSRQTVSCWLQCGCHNIYGAAAGLDNDSVSQLSTVPGLTQVLAFADAVGSFEGLCKAACSQLQRLQFVVQLPEQETMELPLGKGFYHWDDTRKHHLVRTNLSEQYPDYTPCGSAEQRRKVQQQVAEQLEPLLRMAHTLRLQPLLDVLHRFLLLNVDPGTCNSLLSGVAGLVFSDAVLEAALGSGTLSREAYVSSVLSQPCSLTPDKVGHASLLKPTGPRTYDASSGTLEFDAQLLRDFVGGRAGDEVKVTLDLFSTGGGEATVRVDYVAGQLRAN